MEPSLCTPPVKSFRKTPRTQSEASQFNGSHNYKRKQTTLLHREMVGFYTLQDTLQIHQRNQRAGANQQRRSLLFTSLPGVKRRPSEYFRSRNFQDLFTDYLKKRRKKIKINNKRKSRKLTDEPDNVMYRRKEDSGVMIIPHPQPHTPDPSPAEFSTNKSLKIKHENKIWCLTQTHGRPSS